MKTKLNRKRLLGHRGQILAWLIVTFVALSLPLAPRAFAQDPYSRTSGLVTFTDGTRLELEVASHRYMFFITGQTHWFGPHPKTGMHVKVKWRTGGTMEVVEGGPK